MNLPCTLKLRHTGSSNHGRGGEGAMITENLSCTLAASVQDQTLFTGGGGMNPFDRELGETQSVCHQGGVMQVRTESVAFLPTNSANAQSIGAEDELSPTLAKGGGESGNKPSVAIGFKAGQSANGGLGDEREVSPTLSHKPSALEPTVCCNGPQSHSTTRGFGVDVAPTMGAAAGDSGNNKPFLAQSTLAAMRYIVRRLTPTEAERLMGLPSGYTIPAGLRQGFADGAPPPSAAPSTPSTTTKENAL